MNQEEEQRLFAERLEGLRNNACEAPALAIPPDTDPPLTVIPCDVPTIRPDEVFLPPNDPPYETSIDRLPMPILVRNRLLVKYCPEGTVAAPGTPSVITVWVGEEAATQRVFLDNLSDIPQAELYRIGGRISQLQDLIDAQLAEAYTAGSYAALDASIAAQIGVSATIAAAIRSAAVRAQQVADNIAEALASAALDCVWSSRQLWVACDAGSSEGYTIHTTDPGGVFSLVPAGSTTSETSQDDADAKAARLGALTLECLTGNDAQTARCGDVDSAFNEGPVVNGNVIQWVSDVNNPATFGTLIPTPISSLNGHTFMTLDEITKGGAGRVLRLSNTVAANTVHAPTKAEANDMAMAIAVAGMDCFFPSRPRVFACTDANQNSAAHAQAAATTVERVLNELATGDEWTSRAGAKPDNTGVVDAAGGTWTPGEVGKLDARISVRSVVPSGLFVGSSEAEANAQAETLGVSRLECLWRSLPLVYSCDDAESNSDDPDQVRAHVSGGVYSTARLIANKAPRSIFVKAYGGNVNFYALPDKAADTYTTTTERGAFTSDVGQADANQLAANYALATLRCIYCNQKIISPCDATALTYTNDLLGVDYRSNPGAEVGIPPTFQANPVALADVAHTTLIADGLDAGAPYCAEDVDQVVATADIVGSIPAASFVDTSVSCEYGNRAFYAACEASGFLGGDIPLGASRKVMDNGAMNEVAAPPTTPLYSSRSTRGFIMVAANTVRASSQAAADALAEVLAAEQLDCFWDSCKVIAYCGDDIASLTPQMSKRPDDASSTATHVIEGDPSAKLDGHVSVAEASNGSHTRPVVVPARAYQSYESQEIANGSAALTAVTQLVCFYLNREQSSYECQTIGDVFLAPGIVGNGVITSWTSQADADALALTLAETMVQCVDPDLLPAPTETGNALPPFGVGTASGNRCCQLYLTGFSKETALYSGAPNGGWNAVSIDGYAYGHDMPIDCADGATFIYIEADIKGFDPNSEEDLKKPVRERWVATAGNIGFYSEEQPVRDGDYPNFNKVRRLIAQVTSDGKKSCSGTLVSQSISTKQKITGELVGLQYLPIIADMDSPATGDGVAFYCWKNGKPGRIVLSADVAFIPDDPSAL